MIPSGRRLIGPFACLCTAMLALGATPARADGDYRVTLVGEARGDMQVRTEDGARRIDFRYTDRGRGPETHTRLRTDAAGLPVELAVDGNSYFKAAVAERFRRDGERVEWTSAADHGAQAAAGFYLAHESSSELSAALVRALLRAPGHVLPLIPGGQARVEQAGTQTLHTATGDIVATLYLVDGLGYAPAPVWLGADQELLFEGGDWLSVVRKDLVDAAKPLVAAQDAVLQARQETQAKSLARRPATPVAFRGVRLYDAKAKAFLEAMTVVVDGERIVAVGPVATTAVPKDAEVIDGAGRTLLPGLFDMHVHVSADSDGLVDLASGVTSVRDLGNDLDTLQARRASFDSGRFIGPRIFIAAVIDGPGPRAAPTKMLAATPDEARALVTQIADAGIPQVKIYSSVKPELVPVIAQAAHGRGLRVSGHIPSGMTMEQAIRAGYDEVQHANFWMLNFMGAEVAADTNGMGRFTHTGERGADLDLDSKEVADFIALLLEHHTVLDPTLAAMEDVLTGEAGTTPPSLQAVADRLPAPVRRSAVSEGLAKDAAQRERYAASAQRMRELLVKLQGAGVPIVAGTDSGPGSLGLVYELERYVASGLSPADALYTATLGAATVARADGRLGSIETGKLADLVLVEGDASRDLGVLRHAVQVMKGGVLYAPDALFEAGGIAPATRPSPAADAAAPAKPVSD